MSRIVNNYKVQYRLRGVFVLMILLIILPTFGRDKESPKFFISPEVSNQTPYIGEAVIVTFNLYSQTSDLTHASRKDDFSLDRKSEGTVVKIESPVRAQREIINGVEYFKYPLERYTVSLKVKGKYSFKGGEFEITEKYPVVYEDPFWGRRRGYKTRSFILESPDLEMKVKDLPSNTATIDGISEAVGQFHISTTIPPGTIVLEKPARALITLKGYGLLDENILPQYQQAFDGENVRLKSMSESRQTYFDGKNIVSEIILDCEFLPLDMEAELKEVEFLFFNPKSGKYEKTVSSPVKVNVKSITSGMIPVEI